MKHKCLCLTLLQDVYNITKARNKPGFLILSSRDGHISMQPTVLESKKKNYNMNLFHHGSGGLVATDLSKEQNILSLNQTGALQLFQPKGK